MSTNGVGPQQKRGRSGPQRAGWVGALAGLVLLLNTGCAMLGLGDEVTKPPTYSVDPSVPFVVVTVGGAPPTPSTQGVAATIPESTPMPRIELPARDAAAATTPRAAASPSLTRNAQAARAGNP